MPAKRRRVIFFLIPALIAVAAFGWWQIAKYRLAREKLKTSVRSQSLGIYDLDYDRISIDEIGGNLSVSGLRLLPDSARYAALARERRQPAFLLRIELPQLDVTGVSTPKAMMAKEIVARRVLIDHPVIDVALSDSPRGGGNVNKALYEQILGSLKQIRADSILLEHATIRIRRFGGSKPLFEFDDLSCRLSDTEIDSLTAGDSTRLFFSRNVAVALAHFELASRSGLYQYRFDGFRFNAATGSASLDRLALVPALSEEAFAARYKYSRDRFSVTASGISIRRLGVAALGRGSLEADSIAVAKSRFLIYRDISHPHDSTDRTHALPPEQLMALDFPYAIGKVVLADSYIEYKEKNAKSDSSGRVRFESVHAVLRNATNLPARIAADPVLTLDFRSAFLGAADLRVSIDMPYHAPDGRFTVHATLGAMDARALNPMLEPMALASVEDGRIDNLDLKLTGTRHGATGSVKFLYRDLRLSLLKHKDGQPGFKKKLLTTLLSRLLLKDSNPSQGETRVSSIDYPRDRTRSIFHLLWKALFSGLKKTAGMK